MWDIGVINRDGRFDFVSDVAEAGAKNDAGAGRFVPSLTNGGGGGFDLGVEFEHLRCSMGQGVLS
jgi:hypothetical protein